jgi:L-serine deaminase
MTTYPSIFNDVIGPVMRGPSSSHCAASLRIGRICRDLMDGEITGADLWRELKLINQLGVTRGQMETAPRVITKKS